jgi:NAD(P)-dependent dehydrogenase (short-subunit alcohol dehydrogenase family)
MPLLLTGGFGCIGSWIVANLLARGDQVWIYDLKETPHRLRLLLSDEQLRKVRFLPGDVTDLAGLTKALRENGITHVVHLAGLQVPVCRADPMLGAKVNVLGTLVVFEAVKALAGQVQRLVYASSAAVFGPPEDYPPGRVADDVKLTPTTHYGHFKLCNEGNAQVYFRDHGLSSIGLRPWTVYGVGRDFGMTSEPTKAIKAVAAGRPYRISYGGRRRATGMRWGGVQTKIKAFRTATPDRVAIDYTLVADLVDDPSSINLHREDARGIVHGSSYYLPATRTLDGHLVQQVTLRYKSRSSSRSFREYDAVYTFPRPIELEREDA